MLKQLMARIMMTVGLAQVLQAAHDAQNRQNKAPPPYGRRSNSPACAHSFPHHSTNGKRHFSHQSGMGPREMHRRRVGNLGTFRKEAEAWLQ